MKSLVLLIGLTLLTSSYSFSQTAHIQVISDPGFTVFLDDDFKGVTTAEYGGLLIQNVTAGEHRIKIAKEGYSPKEELIELSIDKVYTYNVKKEFSSKKEDENSVDKSIAYSFTDKMYIGKSSENEFEGQFLASDNKIHTYKLRTVVKPMNTFTFPAMLWVDDKLALDQKVSAMGGNYVIEALPGELFLLGSYLNENKESLITLHRFQPSAPMKYPDPTKIILYDDLFNLSDEFNYVFARIPFSDSYEVQHFLNIIGQFSIKDGFVFKIYLDNKLLEDLSANTVLLNFNLNYTIYSITPPIDIQIYTERPVKERIIDTRLKVMFRN